jgi:hypothetical protein
LAATLAWARSAAEGPEEVQAIMEANKQAMAAARRRPFLAANAVTGPPLDLDHSTFTSNEEEMESERTGWVHEEEAQTRCAGAHPEG